MAETARAGRYVLTGDSAHAMAPNLGRGACESLLDAVALASALREHSPAVAVRRYERRRLVAPQAVRWASGAMLGVATTSRFGDLRDRALALLPA